MYMFFFSLHILIASGEGNLKVVYYWILALSYFVGGREAADGRICRDCCNLWPSGFLVFLIFSSYRGSRVKLVDL